tara:strand:- start:1327 stop:2106 length:780 start_codon:yes stop_codon:yes gene_type:complete
VVIESLFELLKNNGIKKGDSICVFSDISRIAIPKSIKSQIKHAGIEILLDSYIETFKKIIGDKGLLIMPTFTYSPFESEVYNINLSKSTVGALTEYFRTRDGVKRSKHPIFSFACWGYNASKFLDFKNYNCFGRESLFGKMYDLNTKYILFGVNMQKGATFIYFSEEKKNVYYRHHKYFISTIQYENRLYEHRVKYFVRDLSVDYQDYWYDLERLSIDNNVAKSIKYEESKVIITNSKDIDSLIQKQLAIDENYLIRKN